MFSNNQNYYKACQSAQFYGIFALFIFNSYIKTNPIFNLYF